LRSGSGRDEGRSRKGASCHRRVSQMRSSAVGLRKDAGGGCGEPAGQRPGPCPEGPAHRFACADAQPRQDAGCPCQVMSSG
jgi:hypothetical protein